jgi:hypothetical protein
MTRRSVLFMQPLAVSPTISIQERRSARTLSLNQVPMRLWILALHDPSLHPDAAGMIASGICQRPWRIHPEQRSALPLVIPFLTRESLIAGTAIGLCCGANKRCSGLSRNSPGEKNYFPAPPGMTRKWKKGAHGVPSTRSGKKRMLPGSPPRPSNLRISYIKTVSPKNFGRFENRCCDLAVGIWFEGFSL